jgi:hypothetical protein
VLQSDTVGVFLANILMQDFRVLLGFHRRSMASSQYGALVDGSAILSIELTGNSRSGVLAELCRCSKTTTGPGAVVPERVGRSA